MYCLDNNYFLKIKKNNFMLLRGVIVKSIWNGSIVFGLVSISVRLYSAIKEHVLGFTLLCKKCHTPIRYERWCRNCHKQVAWADVVKGLKLENGEYFIITQEKLQELKPKTTETIEISEFVPLSEIKPIYIEKHYYIGPSKAGERSYYLFKKALEETKKVAIGRLIMRDKEYVVAIMPYGNGLLLNTLNYAHEIRDIGYIKELRSDTQKLSAQELKLAEQLINQLTHKTFNLEKYKDTFVQELLKEIKKSTKRTLKPGKIRASAEKKIGKKKETNLIESLKASLIAPSRSEQPSAHARSRRRNIK